MSSNAPRQPVRDLRFFLTVPHACSYLEQREATTLFLDPQESPGRGVYDALALLGFRRSGRHLYRPHCEGCSACISVRIPVAEFTPSRKQRQLTRRNADLTSHIRPAIFDPEHYALYAHYIRNRHADGDMYPPSHEQYRTFLTLDQEYARLLEFRLEGRLVAVAAFDQLEHGLSAIYTFFDPAESLVRRSLGTYAVLSLVNQAQQQSLPHVYLGYWIRDCRKMNYKQSFRPLEMLDGRHWRRMITM
ncbi:arginyltransferase [Halomonas urumqiensis]|uniref:Aspartate/glutamate leucyltransferase n=1 Tax=Halomonas urumqiensis TaxID=1684789 RepID=A0A2N7UDU5_9GAMM|nr:arginyltransferase [Halomonas urumqiensis]PMR78603.1 arginyltransferase [Halomonas urumqiensis]PTB03747.1 arginyltransferase [Halomonas urumqiensis]GHE20031.1 putative arginyl-tRNA--protein transferase [Halomonas urumqiensis]